MVSKLLQERIVNLAFTSIQQLPIELKRLGLECEVFEKGECLVIRNEYMRVGLMESDPITKATQLGFAICGPLWASALPTLLEEVDREWRQRRKEMKS